MTHFSANADDEGFVPRRPITGDALLSSSGQLAVSDILALIASSRFGRHQRAEQAAEVIRRIGPYRWVGIYDVGPEDASVFVWAGIGPPAFVRFPITAGLTGEAIRSLKTVVVNDVSSDPRYLTSFAGTRAEIIVPVLDSTRARVVGTIDVESDKQNAFSAEDQKVLEKCAVALEPLWA